MESKEYLNRIRGKRTEKRITQEEMAERLGMAVKTYNFKENGKAEFTIEEIATLLNILGCSFNDIFLP